ncbi:MAG: phage major capsid protein [Clostridia bacterium]|nr:phage major capsid protein [Clostridia bacterium]
MVTTQTADKVLKSYYLSAVTDQLNKSVNPFLAQIKQTASDVWGRDVRKAVRVGLNGGVGAGTETGALPTASGNRYEQFVSTLKNLYGTIEISDKAIRASSSNEGAFVDLLNDEMQSLVESASYNFGRMLFGDGTGAIAKVTGAAGPIYTCEDADGLAEGMIVDMWKGTTQVIDGKKILSVDRKNKKVKIEGGPVAFTAGESANLYVHGSKNLEITGLKAIFDSDTLYGVTRSGNEWLEPYKEDDVGALTEAALQKAIDTVEERSGSKVNFIVTSPGVRRAFFNTLSQYRQIDTVELEGGFRAISFNGIPIVTDRFCQKNTMYLLNTEDFGLHQLCDWQWLEGEDGKVLKQLADKPVFRATLVKYAELMCYRPAGQARLSGITEA